MFTTSHMDRLGYLGYPNDAEVDALLSQLSDESLLKLKVNTHNTSSRSGFEYPTFTDQWVDDDATQALDTQLTSRFSSLKRPIAPAAKKGKDSLKVAGQKGSDSDRGVVSGKKGNSNRDSSAVGDDNSSRNSQSLDKTGRASDVMGWKAGEERGEESRRLSSKPSSRTSSRRRGEDHGSSSRRQHPIKRDGSRSSSGRTEFYSSRSSDDPNAVAAEDDDEDLDSIDALLNERFRALKGTPPASSTSSSTPPSTGNLGLDNLIQISGQLSTQYYEGYGSSFTVPPSPSPSANLLGRSKSRSSPRVMTNSVATSCHCSTPSPLKLLKQVGSKSFPSKQQLSPGSLPPLSPAPGSSPSVQKAGKEYQVEGFGNSKPAGKDSEKTFKEKKEKEKARKSSNDESNNINPSTIKDMRRLLSSVADRVGLERSRVSSAVDDELFPGEDLNGWSVMDGEREFSRASLEEEQQNREAERVVEWAKDAARLGTGDSDIDSEVDDFGLEGEDDEKDSSQSKPSKKGKPNRKGVKVAPKKKWGLF